MCNYVSSTLRVFFNNFVKNVYIYEHNHTPSMVAWDLLATHIKQHKIFAYTHKNEKCFITFIIINVFFPQLADLSMYLKKIITCPWSTIAMPASPLVIPLVH